VKSSRELSVVDSLDPVMAGRRRLRCIQGGVLGLLAGVVTWGAFSLNVSRAGQQAALRFDS